MYVRTTSVSYLSDRQNRLNSGRKQKFEYGAMDISQAASPPDDSAFDGAASSLTINSRM